MNPFRKILLAYDFSDNCRAALAGAVALAQRFGAELTVVTAIEKSPDDVVLKAINLPSDIEARLLGKVGEELKAGAGLGNLRPQIQVRKGKPAIEILMAIEEHKPDLVMMGSKGRTGMKRVLLGSVAEKVVQRSPAPVWVCRNSGKLPKKILVTTDFSDLSREAFEPAAQLATALGAELHVLNAVDLRALYAIDPLGLDISPSFADKLRNEAEAELRNWTSGLKPAPILAVRSGAPAYEIEDYVESTGIDLVVISTHGRGGLGHLLIGGVADQVIRYGSSSVMTVCPKALRHSLPRLFDGPEQFEQYVRSFRE